MRPTLGGTAAHTQGLPSMPLAPGVTLGFAALTFAIATWTARSRK